MKEMIKKGKRIPQRVVEEAQSAIFLRSEEIVEAELAQHGVRV